ncbi:MAG: sulfotransferase, partial [Hypericibacter sp.]
MEAAAAGMPEAGTIPPLFIGGCGRSGTTLLSDLLGCHSQLSPIYEPGFIMNVASLIFFNQET